MPISQHDLDSEVARVTGESLRTIRRRGFSIVDLNEQQFDSEPDDTPAMVLDWDSYQPMPLARAA
jgi:acetolactate synthase regulatory subunit